MAAQGPRGRLRLVDGQGMLPGPAGDLAYGESAVGPNGGLPAEARMRRRRPSCGCARAGGIKGERGTERAGEGRHRMALVHCTGDGGHACGGVEEQHRAVARGAAALADAPAHAPNRS